MKKELTPHQRKVLKQKDRFSRSEDLREAFFMANRGVDAHGRFLHYTTLSRVVQIVGSGRWWLTRADSDTLNDVQEAKKFGNAKLLSRTFQASFSYGSAENAAMWGLYCPGDPLGVMISFDGKAMQKWFDRIRKKEIDICMEYPSSKANHGRHVSLPKSKIEMADVRDVIYVATKNSMGYLLEKDRSDTLYWFDARTDKIENLAQQIGDNESTGWLKDYEWRQENESRIAVRVKNVAGALPNHLSVQIDDAVLKSMRFTLSPWLRNEYCEEVSKTIRALVARLHEEKLPKRIVSRSVITGALESWRSRYHGCSQKVVSANH